jgi:hypothetical protein
MLSQKKSILARLLSNENIDIRHGNYDTAAFDVVNRVLFLPVWDNVSEDLYDLMTGHEVGHALYTPADGWHESTRKFDFPRAFVNIIEDIRIEKLIQTRYPGLRRSFITGYKELSEKDFFGLSTRSIDTLSFMDRLNIKAKLRTLIDVDFTDEEQYYFDLAYTPETFDEVLLVCQEIYEWLNTKDNDCTPPPSDTTGYDQDNTFQEGSSTFAPEDTQESEEMSAEGGAGSSDEAEESDETPDGGGSLEESKGTGEKPALDSESSNDPAIDEMETYTDDTFRKKESSLIEKDRYGNSINVSYGIDGYDVNDLIVNYKEVMNFRRDNIASLSTNDYLLVDTTENFNEFIGQAEKFTNLMAREFEMRKRASQLSRAKESKTGKLDMTKLSSYKFSDNIFLSNTEIPEGKSHGIVAIIDFSGSMGSVIQNVIDQAITLAMFCRKANIPFDIYSFTSGHYLESNLQPTQGLNQVIMDQAIIVHQLSSKMKKSEFNEAVRLMYLGMALRRLFRRGYDTLGGTPLDHTLLVMNKILDRFKAANGLEKVTFMTITDGDSHGLEFKESAWNKSTKVKIDNKFIKCGTYRSCTPELLAHVQSKGYNTVGYFICNTSRDLRYQTKYYIPQCQEEAKEKIKVYRKNGFVSIEKTGYDTYFVLNGKIDAVDDEFEVKDSAKTNEIKTAFKKHSSSKKSKRIFATYFAEAVA